MKVLHVVPSYFPAVRYGGPVYSVHSLCKNLVKAGLKIDVLTTNIDGTGISEVPVGRDVVLDGVTVRYCPSPWLRRLYYSPSMKRYLTDHISQYDLLHIHSIFLWPTNMAARIAQDNNIPYILSPRGMLDKALIKKKNTIIKKLWISFMEAKTIENATAVHVTSKHEKELLSEFNFNFPEILEIANGVEEPMEWDLSKVSPDVRSVIKQQPFALYLGRINWKKGLDRLIAAMKSVPARVMLVIAGNDEEDYSREIKRIASEAGVSNRLLLIPRFVSGADKEALFATSRLFILPSYSENFGNTVLEAMIRKVPVIVTPEVGLASEVEQSGAGRVAKGDAGAIASAISELIDNEVLL
ncbi:MAG TPA: glycosyltransferase, partial [Gammaproteobacteria bacterium]|nr:glycosyltransferase [Gammaproteobacteria bacterium]